MTSGHELRGGGRFSLTTLDDPPRVIKRGDRAPLAREARALRLLAGTGLAPQLIRSQPGMMTMQRLPGTPRPLQQLDDGDLRRLGATIRRVHELRRRATGARHVWPGRAGSLAAYARRRLADMDVPDGPLTAVVGQIAAGLASSAPAGGMPFRLVHGDLVGDNIVWAPQPMLVDWEFWRIGDPAEDLGYLFAVNDLGDGACLAVLEGYGDPSMEARAAAWRPACALDAGLWYLRGGHTKQGRKLVADAARSVSAPRRS